MLRLVTCLMLVVSMSQAAVAQWGGFVCSPQASAGLVYNEATRRWVSGALSIPERLIVRRTTAEHQARLEAVARSRGLDPQIYFGNLRSSEWWIERPGSPLPFFICERRNEDSNNHWLTCNAGSSYFSLNVDDMIFAYSTAVGGGTLYLDFPYL